MKENNLETEKKIIQNLLNLPFLALMLEELTKEAADHNDLLIYDEKTGKLCKFVEEGYECLNTSLETVTQRSLLSGEISGKKFKRFEFVLKPSLTKLAMNRKEAVFVSNVLKHPDYNEIDNPCIPQAHFNCRSLTI